MDLTRLTTLTLTMESGVHVTFPTGLKQLFLEYGPLANTNIGDVSLETFRAGWPRRITRPDLETLPKTVKWIGGKFKIESLEDEAFDLLPQLDSAQLIALPFQ